MHSSLNISSHFFLLLSFNFSLQLYFWYLQISNDILIILSHFLTLPHTCAESHFWGKVKSSHPKVKFMTLTWLAAQVCYPSFLIGIFQCSLLYPYTVLLTFPLLLNFLATFTFQISRAYEYTCVYQDQIKPIEKN